MKNRALEIYSRASLALSHFLFPPLCLHCLEKVAHRAFFCLGCTGFFELIDSATRCPYCFTENEALRVCRECRETREWHVKMASALDYVGPVTTFVKQLKQGRLPYLARPAASFMVAQFVHLKWPEPDLVIPVPARSWWQGMNHAALLAHELGKTLQLSVVCPVRRTRGTLSQARLSKTQRQQLATTSFFLKKRAYTLLQGKRLLLVDDVLTTGSTLRRMAETLLTASPKEIYALTLARAL